MSLSSTSLLGSLAALGAGFGVIVGFVAISTWLAGKLAPQWNGSARSRGVELFNLAASSAFCALGGCLTAHLAPISPLVHALILALIVLLLSALAAAELRTASPGIYPFALTVLPSVATLAGGILIVLYR